jgi:hypothetical protein
LPDHARSIGKPRAKSSLSVASPRAPVVSLRLGPCTPRSTIYFNLPSILRHIEKDKARAATHTRRMHGPPSVSA